MDDSWDDPEEATGIFDPSRSGAEDRWYISRDGHTKEPVTAGQIIDLCTTGSINEGTLVWREGLSDWSPLGEVPELAQALRAFSRHPVPAGHSVPPVPPGQRPSLPSLPAHPSLPPDSTHPSDSPARRLSLRVSSHIVNERKGMSLHPMGHVAVPLVGSPVSLFTREEPYSIIVPGGKRIGVWSLAAGFGVFFLATLLGMVIFGGEEDVASAQPPIVIDYDRERDESDSEAKSKGASEADAPTKGSDDDDGKQAAGAGPAVEVIDGEAKPGDAPAESSKKSDEAKQDDTSKAKQEAAKEAAQAEEEEEEEPTGAADKGQPVATIDREAVNVTLAKAADEVEASCSPSGEAKGAGKVRVLFTPAGTVATVKLLTLRFRGTPAGDCVKKVFEKAKVPPYEGGNVAALKLFSVK